MQPARTHGIQTPHLQSERLACEFRSHRNAQRSFPRRQERMTDVGSGLRYWSLVLRLVRTLLRHPPGVMRHKRKAATQLLKQASQTTQHLCSQSRIYQS